MAGSDLTEDLPSAYICWAAHTYFYGLSVAAGAVRSALDWDSWAWERVEQPRTMAVAGKSDVFG